MNVRPATRDDIAALAALQERHDTHWLGGAEQDEADAAETLGLAASLETGTRVVEADGRLIGAALVFGAESLLTADPTADAAAVHAVLIPWIETTAAEQIDALAPDETLQGELTRRGWTYDHSAFDLLRGVDDGWVPPAPSWPAGVTRHEYGPALRDEVHELIYGRAGYGDVRGHRRRAADEWERLFVQGRPEHELPVLGRRDGRLVGVAVGRMFADGTGWVAQLAVDRAEQGQGIGTALMLESFARRLAEGATALGLSVSAANRGALRLYESVGLRVEREWRTYHRPAA